MQLARPRTGVVSPARSSSLAAGGERPHAISRPRSRLAVLPPPPRRGAPASLPGPRSARRDAEDARQGRHLANGGVRYPPTPYPLDLLLGEVPSAHSGHIRVGLGLSRPLVLDHPEEVLEPPGDVAAAPRRLYRCPVAY